MQVHLLESIAAYFYALQGRPEQAPELFREHKLAEVSFFGPCRPMMSLIEQQVWLAQGEYVKVIAHSEGLLRRCEAYAVGLGASPLTAAKRAQIEGYNEDMAGRACGCLGWPTGMWSACRKMLMKSKPAWCSAACWE